MVRHPFFIMGEGLMSAVISEVRPCIGKTSSKSVATDVFRAQAEAMERLIENLDDSFDAAVNVIMGTVGRVVVCGMGKSGIIGKKIAATFASTGTPSFFMHPAEAFHGDLGMITKNDCVILISYSGETDEVIRLIPSLKRFGVNIISLVGDLSSTLARNSHIALDVSVEREACPNNLAPTTSTVATLAMGDALAVSLITRRGFTRHDFANFHPGGSLGRKLLTRVSDVMHRDDLPVVDACDRMDTVIMAMTSGRLGLAVVKNGDQLFGIITDGDLRRALLHDSSAMNKMACDIATLNPITVSGDMMFSDAEFIMRENKVNALLVTGKSMELVGVLQIFDF